MAAKVKKKDRMEEEVRQALGWSRMPSNTDGVYLTVDGCRVILDLIAESRGEGGPLTVVEKAVETAEEVHARIAKRFHMLGRFTQGTVNGNFKALIIQGPPGLGKTHSVTEVLDQYDPDETQTTRIAGKLTAIQLYKSLWDRRHEGNILLLDDCDSVFSDETSLNLLKAALDSHKKRIVSYKSDTEKFSDLDGSAIPNHFEFQGTVIFITNLDFDHAINSGHRLAPHFEALKSRSTYVSLGMRSREEYMIRIEQIGDQLFPNADERVEILGFMRTYLQELDEVSARMAVKIRSYREEFGVDWMDMAKESCFRT